MIIIAHRINTIKVLKELPEKYGVEIDVRADNRKLILNHDPHKPGEELSEYFKYYNHRMIIFNIKTTGIEKEIIELAKRHNITEYFFLDVEYPFIFKSMKKGFSKIAIRFSEYEPIEYVLSHSNKLNWVWVDTFNTLPLNKEKHDKMKKSGFKLCLVSPEQLGRPQDILKYKKYCQDNEIVFDAVMCETDKINLWEDNNL